MTIWPRKMCNIYILESVEFNHRWNVKYVSQNRFEHFENNKETVKYFLDTVINFKSFMAHFNLLQYKCIIYLNYEKIYECNLYFGLAARPLVATGDLRSCMSFKDRILGGKQLFAAGTWSPSTFSTHPISIHKALKGGLCVFSAVVLMPSPWFSCYCKTLPP